jgi:hypothetical protein
VTIGVALDPRVEWPRVFLAPSARWRGRGLSALLYPMGDRFVDATGQARFVSLSGPTPIVRRGALGVYSPFGNLRMSGIGQGQTFSRIALVVPDSLAVGTIITSTIAGSSNGSQWRITSGGEHELLRSAVVSIGVSSGARIAAGKLSVVGITYDGTTARFFSDGNACGSATSSQTFTIDTGSMFGRSDNSESIAGAILGYAEFAGRVLSPSEMASLTGAPGQLFEEEKPASVYFFSAGAAPSAGAGSSSVTFAANAQGAALKPAAGSSSVTFAATGTGAATKPAAGTSSITFSATGEGTTGGNTAGAGSSSITFAATGAGASIRAATGSSSITFSVQGVSTAPAAEETAVPQAGGHGAALRKRRRYILPDDTEVLATDVEIRDILRAFVKPKPQPTKRGKVARVVPLAEQVTFEPDEKQQAERVVLRMGVATWEPDQQMYEAMVRDMVVRRRRRRTVELLLMAA